MMAASTVTGHATRRSASKASKGGGAVRQDGSTSGQRGANGQPASPAAEPTLPGISLSRLAE